MHRPLSLAAAYAQGLFSVAFSPGFHSTGVFFVSYMPEKRVSGGVFTPAICALSKMTKCRHKTRQSSNQNRTKYTPKFG